MQVTSCPICGGRLEATLEQYTVGVVLDKKGRVETYGEDAGIGEESRVYCENDHTYEEIVDALDPKTQQFEKFKATGYPSHNLGHDLSDDALDGCPGRIYCKSLYIEDVSYWPDNSAIKHGQWYTRIGNIEYQSDDIEQVERPLFQFALSEGLLD